MARKSNAARGRRRVPNPSTQPRRSRASASAKVPKKGPYATVGRDLGGLLGFADVGDRVGGAIGRLFGRGDYQVHLNSLMESYGKPAAGPPPPMTFRDGKRGVRVVEREYLGDITSGPLVGSSTLFTNNSYPLNPANATTFPWLSRIARQFDQWEPHGIVFEFRSTSSEYNGTSQALGTIILATDYDPTDPAYVSKAEAENSDYAMSVKSSDCAIHGIECDPKERPTAVLYTSSGSQSDPRFTDLGTFQLCTQGMSVADVTLGELWVTYDITFYKKQVIDSPSSGEMHRLVVSSTVGNNAHIFGTEDLRYTEIFMSPPTFLVEGDGFVLPPTCKIGSKYAFVWTVKQDADWTTAPDVVTVGCALTNSLSPDAPPHPVYLTEKLGTTGIVTSGVVEVNAVPVPGTAPAVRFVNIDFHTVTYNVLHVVEISPTATPFYD